VKKALPKFAGFGICALAVDNQPDVYQWRGILGDGSTTFQVADTTALTLTLKDEAASAGPVVYLALTYDSTAGKQTLPLYVDGVKYILENIPVVLAKANQGLATLEKYRSRLDQVSTRLTALEFEGGVTLHDVLTVLQRAELVTRMAAEIERHIVELGSEGRLIEMQLDETMVGVSADKAALVHDYLIEDSDETYAIALYPQVLLPHQDLLDCGRSAQVSGHDHTLTTPDYHVSPPRTPSLAPPVDANRRRNPRSRFRPCLGKANC